MNDFPNKDAVFTHGHHMSTSGQHALMTGWIHSPIRHPMHRDLR